MSALWNDMRRNHHLHKTNHIIKEGLGMATEQELATQKEKKRTIDAIFWGGAFIIAGLVFLAENLEILPEIGDAGEWWFWIFLGAGVWALLINIFRLTSADWPNPDAGDYFWTAVLLLVGIGGATDFDIDGSVIAAVVLVGLGVLLLGNTLRQRAA
jgi:hypothetical protein